MDQAKLAELVERSGSTDLAHLLKAKESAKSRMDRDPSRVNVKAFEEAKVALEKEVSKVSGEDSGRVFKNLNQAHQFLTGEAGFRVSYNTLKKHLVDETPPRARKRRGGGWTAGVLQAYAAAHLVKQVDEAAGADTPVKPGKAVAAGNGDADEPGAAEARTRAHADKLAVQTERERMKLDLEKGRLVETSTVERELADRAKAFRLGLVGYAPKLSEDLAAHFGGDRAVALELCRVLGVDEALAPRIMDFAQGKAQEFGRGWPAKVEAFLDPYSTDAWWTPAMREAWERHAGGASAPLAQGALPVAGEGQTQEEVER